MMTNAVAVQQSASRRKSSESAAPDANRNYAYLEQYSQDQLDITFYIACYNEEANIIATIETIVDAMGETKLTYEMVVIDDGSRDRSVEIVKEYIETHPWLSLRLFVNPRNLGLARSFVEGAFLGRSKYYKLVCGDNVTPKQTLLDTLALLGTADIIIPYHPVIEGRGVFRTKLSHTFTGLINFMTGNSLHYYNGCAVYRRVDVMRWHSRSTGFGFQAELVTSLLEDGASYVEIAVPASERSGGKSTALRLKNWLSVSHSLLEIFLRQVRRKLFC